MSIVVTAVYILRAVGQVSMGPIKQEYMNLNDARWNERWAAVILITGILLMGIMPSWLNDLVTPGVDIIMDKLAGK
jgi:NADH-quinone oxidoreductase subunit M